MIRLTPLEETVAGQELIQTGVEKGVKQGVKQGVKNIAENMLKMGLDIKTVSRATGLSEKEIKQLKASVQM